MNATQTRPGNPDPSRASGPWRPNPPRPEPEDLEERPMSRKPEAKDEVEAKGAELRRK